MRRLASVVGLMIAIVVLPSCATIFGGGGRQSMNIASVPRGADVTVDGIAVGRTPLVAHLDRKGMATVVTIEAQGYRPYTIVLKRGINHWVWGNFFFLPGLLVDVGTGAIYKLTPERIQVELQESRWKDLGMDENGVYLFVGLEPEVEGLELIGHLVRE